MEEIAKTLIISFGIIGVLIIAGIVIANKLFINSIDHTFSKRLENHKTQLAKDLEKLKSLLKNTELIFQKKLDALTSLIKLSYDVLPEKYHPDMEWDEACDEIAINFEKIGKEIEGILTSFEPVMPNNVTKLLNESLTICTNGKFEVTNDVSEEGNKMADKLFSKIQQSIKLFKNNLNSDFQVDFKV